MIAPAAYTKFGIKLDGVAAQVSAKSANRATGPVSGQTEDYARGGFKLWEADMKLLRLLWSLHSQHFPSHRLRLQKGGII